MLHMLVSSFASLLNVQAILLILGGTLLGTFVGSVPGLGGVVLYTMLLPFIYGMNPLPALALLLAAHTAIYFSSSITAILLNMPGAPESAAICFDGYAMTQQGKGARALGISAATTTIGGWVGVVFLVIMIPFMHRMVTWFQPSGYFLLAILAIALIGQLRSGSLTKGLLSGLFGLMISFVGYDPITGVQRFSFGCLSLYNGFNITAVALGIFGMSEMFILYGKNRAVADNSHIDFSSQPGSRVLDGVKDVFRGHLWLSIRSAGIGAILGLVPGIGGLAANFISYGQAMKSSKHPDTFGTGIPEGIIAPASSSISKEAGSLVPTCALGIPSGAGMAVLMSAFTILGLAPGPSMLVTHLNLVYAMAIVIAIGSLLASVTGLFIAPVLTQVSRVPGPVLVPFIFTVGYLGVYAAALDFAQVAFVIVFGIVGLLAKRYQYSLAAILIGFILGRIAEKNLYLTVNLEGTRAFYQPMSDLLIVLIAIILFGPFLSKYFRKGGRKAQQEVVRSKTRLKTLRFELIVDIVWVAFSAAYLWVAHSYPPAARRIPDVVGCAALIAGLVQLSGDFIPALQPLTHMKDSAGEQDSPASPKEEDPLLEMKSKVKKPKISSSVEIREWLAVGWALVYLISIFILGYTVAVPLFFLVYFLFLNHRNWKMAAISTCTGWLLTWGVFEQLLAIHLPGAHFFF